MDDKHFTEEDKLKLIAFLNAIDKHAKFEFNTKELIDYFKLLSYMQSKMLPKIHNHILEVKEVIEPEDEVKE